MADRYDEMAAFTRDLCDRVCTHHGPYRCCDRLYCELALENAQRAGESLPTTSHPALPLMGPDMRCTAPARLRPLCAVHHCDIESIGCFKPRPNFPMKEAVRQTRRYWRLRNKLSEEEMTDGKRQIQ